MTFLLVIAGVICLLAAMTGRLGEFLAYIVSLVVRVMLWGGVLLMFVAMAGAAL